MIPADKPRPATAASRHPPAPISALSTPQGSLYQGKGSLARARVDARTAAASAATAPATPVPAFLSAPAVSWTDNRFLDGVPNSAQLRLRTLAADHLTKKAARQPRASSFARTSYMAPLSPKSPAGAATAPGVPPLANRAPHDTLSPPPTARRMAFAAGAAPAGHEVNEVNDDVEVEIDDVTPAEIAAITVSMGNSAITPLSFERKAESLTVTDYEDEFEKEDAEIIAITKGVDTSTTEVGTTTDKPSEAAAKY